MSNCLDPDQDRHSVRLDLGLNCLQRLSADEVREELKVADLLGLPDCAQKSSEKFALLCIRNVEQDVYQNHAATLVFTSMSEPLCKKRAVCAH